MRLHRIPVCFDAGMALLPDNPSHLMRKFSPFCFGSVAAYKHSGCRTVTGILKQLNFVNTLPKYVGSYRLLTKDWNRKRFFSWCMTRTRSKWAGFCNKIVTCNRPSSVLGMVTHLVGWAPPMIITVFNFYNQMVYLCITVYDLLNLWLWQLLGCQAHLVSPTKKKYCNDVLSKL
jgi:hypothetical protein